MLTKEEKAQFAIRKALRKNAILCLNEKKLNFRQQIDTFGLFILRKNHDSR